MSLSQAQIDQALLRNGVQPPSTQGGVDTGGITPGGGTTFGGTSSDYRNSLSSTDRQWLSYNGIDPSSASDTEIAYALLAGGRGGLDEWEIIGTANIPDKALSGLYPEAPGDEFDHPATVSFGGTLYAWIPDENGVPQLTPIAADPEGGGGGGAGNAVGFGQIAENRRQFNLTHPEDIRQFNEEQALAEQQAAQGYLQNRATTGVNFGEFVRGLSNDAYERAKDPGNFPAYLAASAGIPQTGGSPINQLLGQGTTIQSPEGANPLADPRFENLLGELYGYAKPSSLETVQGLAAAGGGKLPQAFYDYTKTQNPDTYARGGSEILREPVMGMGMWSQKPQFIAGEAGDERATFTPINNGRDQYQRVEDPFKKRKRGEGLGGGAPPVASRGGMRIPEMIDMQPIGQASAEMGIPQYGMSPISQIPTMQPPSPIRQFALGGQMDIEPLAEGGTYSPAQGTNLALGKALRPLGYVQRGALDQLAGGRAPTPGAVDEATMSRLPPSLRLLLSAGIKSQVGGAGLMDWLAAQEEYKLPGGTSGYLQNQYG